MENAIKIIFLIFFFTINFAYAESTEYRYIIEYYGLKKDNVLGASEGTIDGQYYLALSANKLFPEEESNQNLYIVTLIKNQPHLVMKIDLQLNDSFGFSLKINNNSIYIQRSVAHHGWYDERFQFKKINQEFKLVGIEQQSLRLGCYAGDDTSPECEKYEMWYGNSYNLMTYDTICWSKKLFTTQESNEVHSRYEKWLQPKSGMRHHMKFSKMTLPLLYNFNFYEFEAPKSCYFDGFVAQMAKD